MLILGTGNQIYNPTIRSDLASDQAIFCDQVTDPACITVRILLTFLRERRRVHEAPLLRGVAPDEDEPVGVDRRHAVAVPLELALKYNFF